MMRYRRSMIGLFAALLAMSALLIAACDDGDTEAQLADVERQAAAERERASVLESELAEAQRQAQELSEQLAAAAEEEDEDITVILAVYGGVEPPEPSPRGEPPVPGPEYEQPVGDFVFYVENLTASGVTEWGYQFNEGCVQSSIFKRGSKMVWRIEVIDRQTGLRVMPEHGDVVVRLAHGEERAGRFSQRGGGRVEGAPFMWATAWNIPPDYPVGTLDYEVVVQMNDGRNATWRMPYTGTQVQVVE